MHSFCPSPVKKIFFRGTFVRYTDKSSYALPTFCHRRDNLFHFNGTKVYAIVDSLLSGSNFQRASFFTLLSVGFHWFLACVLEMGNEFINNAKRRFI